MHCSTETRQCEAVTVESGRKSTRMSRRGAAFPIVAANEAVIAAARCPDQRPGPEKIGERIARPRYGLF